MKKSIILFSFIFFCLVQTTFSQTFFGPFTDSNDKFKEFYKSYFQPDEKILKTWYHYTVSYSEKDERYILRLFHPEKRQIFSETRYIDKKLKEKDGLSMIYMYPERSVKVGVFKDGKEEGRWRILDSTGVVISKYFYVNGLIEGNSSGFYNNGQVKEKLFYVNGKLNGEYVTYHKNGKVKEEGVYAFNYQEGEFKEYDSLSVLKKLTIFKKGEQLKVTDYTKENKPKNLDEDPNGIYKGTEVMAYFKGNCPGIIDEKELQKCNLNAMYRYLGANIKYPVRAQRFNVSGKIFVNFVVEKDGSIGEIKLLTTLCESLDSESIRVIANMPKWEPGFQDGKPVRVYYNMPIIYKLD